MSRENGSFYSMQTFSYKNRIFLTPVLQIKNPGHYDRGFLKLCKGDYNYSVLLNTDDGLHICPFLLIF